MRNFKIGLWIFFVLLIQTVVLARVHVFGAAPSLALGYVVCVMMLENEFKDAVIISIVVSVLMGALCGRGFEAVTLFYVYSSIAIFSFRKKPRYMGTFAKALLWTFICSSLLEVILSAPVTMTVSADMLLTDALPTAIINTVLAAVIYPILKKTMYSEEKKKLLIV